MYRYYNGSTPLNASCSYRQLYNCGCLISQICSAHLNIKNGNMENQKNGARWTAFLHFSMSVNDRTMLLPHLVPQYIALTKMDQSKISESVRMMCHHVSSVTIRVVLSFFSLVLFQTQYSTHIQSQSSFILLLKSPFHLIFQLDLF